MNRKQQAEEVVAEILLDGSCPQEQVLQPLLAPNETTRRYLSGWETPHAPRGGYSIDSGVEVVRIRGDGRTVLHFPTAARDKTLLWTDGGDMRDYRVVAEVLPYGTSFAGENIDQADRLEALIGIVFRVRTSREYYQFGIQGRRRAVLYRRKDEEWHVLAEKDVELPDQDLKLPDGDAYVKLEVDLDGDAIRCRCESLGVNFSCVDTTYPVGKPGVRVIGVGRVLSLRLTQTPSQKVRADVYRRIRETEERRLSENVPDPVLVRTLDINELPSMPKFHDFARPGCYDMLFFGDSLKAMTADGKPMWEVPLPTRSAILSREHTAEHGRLIYAFTGEIAPRGKGMSVSGQVHTVMHPKYISVISGADGKVLAQTEIPKLDVQVQPVLPNASTANLTGTGGFDFVLAEGRYDCNGGGLQLWAYDKDLNQLWHSSVKQPYGHSNAVQYFDVDGCGRDEVLAGGALFDSQGKLLWIHDLAHEMDQIPGADHYDSAAIGNFAGDQAVDPVVFLCAGSAGVYVVDGLTGRTRMTHRIGHAQGHLVVKVRKDIPGQQLLVPNRWANFGILTLFSGHGDRLWSIHPSYVSQGAGPVAWPDPEEQLIYYNTAPQSLGLFDGYGRKVKDLPEFRQIWGNRMRRDMLGFRGRIGDDPRDMIGIGTKEEGKIYLYAPEA